MRSTKTLHGASLDEVKCTKILTAILLQFRWDLYPGSISSSSILLGGYLKLEFLVCCDEGIYSRTYRLRLYKNFKYWSHRLLYCINNDNCTRFTRKFTMDNLMILIDTLHNIQINESQRHILLNFNYHTVTHFAKEKLSIVLSKSGRDTMVLISGSEVVYWEWNIG
jgi:hypothetical protein